MESTEIVLEFSHPVKHSTKTHVDATLTEIACSVNRRSQDLERRRY